MKWIIWLDTDGARRYLNLSNLHCLCDILMVSVSPTGWYMGYVPAIRLPSNLPSVNKQCCRQRHQAHPLHDLQYYVRNLSGRFVTASLVNLDMWQWKILIYLINILVAGERLQDGMSTQLSRPRVLSHEGVLAVGGIKTQPKLQADALRHGEYVPLQPEEVIHR